ncbi:MAG: hypothetical protein JHD35_21210 [Sphingopyxis sp.]|nr:hypothetical protein [Sphingopyxis sp.]
MTKPKPDAPSQDAPVQPAPLVVEAVPVEQETPPTYAKIGVTPMAVCERLRVVDAETGDLIAKVIEADAETGRVVRYAVEGGNLVREGDRMKVIEEERKIRIEWRTGKQKDSF